jgi:hypothetical protein
MANYFDTTTRWVESCMGYTDKPLLKNQRIIAERDRIFSYGSHFEIARMIRDRKQPSHWLINGDRFSNTTSRHQSEVLSSIIRRGGSIPRVTIPYSALEAADVVLDSVQIIESTSDRWETINQRFEEMPPQVKWQWETTYADMGGWQNSLTGEFHARMKQWGEPRPKQRTCEACETPPNYLSYVRGVAEEDRQAKYREYTEAEEIHEAHQRLRHGVWEEVPHHIRNTGRKTLVPTRGWQSDWDLVDDPESMSGVAYVVSRRRHWLGESLVKAKVRYRGRQWCSTCAHTGIVEPYSEQFADDQGYGPLTQRQDYYAPNPEQYLQLVLEQRVYRHRTVAATRLTDQCGRCLGSGWINTWKTRSAYFLSGFDSNEARVSYFFAELPPKVKPTTVAEAYETLKTGAVRLAEQVGREVQRQGDVWIIPMPDLTLKQLLAEGGVHVKREVAYIKQQRGPSRRISYTDASLFGTNHTASEVVRVGTLTYARGIVRHEPEGRQPDHARTKIADGKTWALCQKNTVPIGRA